MGGWLILHFTPSSTLLALSRNLHQTGCSLQLWNRLPRKCECFFFHLAQRLCTNSLAMPSCNISCGVCVCVCSVISQLQNCWVLIQSHCSMMCLWILVDQKTENFFPCLHWSITSNTMGGSSTKVTFQLISCVCGCVHFLLICMLFFVQRA